MSIADIAVAVVGLIHVVIAIAEIFLWKPLMLHKRLERLDLNDVEGRKMAPIIANAGLYNGFIAAGLFWSVFVNDLSSLKLFFLSCAAIAGVFGAVTLKL